MTLSDKIISDHDAYVTFKSQTGKVKFHSEAMVKTYMLEIAWLSYKYAKRLSAETPMSDFFLAWYNQQIESK